MKLNTEHIFHKIITKTDSVKQQERILPGLCFRSVGDIQVLRMLPLGNHYDQLCLGKTIDAPLANWKASPFTTRKALM